MSVRSDQAAPAPGVCPHYPFADRPGISLAPEYAGLFADEPLVPVQLPNGRQALLVTKYEDVKTVLADPRFSREAWRNGTLFARDSSTLALVTSDAPTHTRRRRAVQHWFTHRSAERARPRIAAIAARLVDDIAAAESTVDLISAFTTPLPYQVICELLGIPVDDLELLLPRVTVMMSAGRFPADEVAAAHEAMYEYFFGQLAARERAVAAGEAGDDLLTGLLTAPEESRLSTQEIAVFGFGLLMAGGETTASHLAMCVLQLLRRPTLAEALRRDPAGIPAFIEEMLRWVWFAGTGGQPHVALAEVELAGTVIGAGQVVVPLTDAANRDPEVFAGSEEFRPDRTPNPHLGLGHGRHMCLGAAHARVELQEGMAAILPHVGRMELAVDESQLDWRSRMFMRGLWTLPVRWRGGETGS
ncbi:cytochrome P450 [Actinoplanes sp. NPDC049118]|uniref:cytochrome P450 n=1 Tax=Actinoplanes sp. NPDC049118 TaxID=3155769 RepID=UPI0033E4FA47